MIVRYTNCCLFLYIYFFSVQHRHLTHQHHPLTRLQARAIAQAGTVCNIVSFFVSPLCHTQEMLHLCEET